MTFSQVQVSPTLEKTFGENFRNRWGLSKYSNNTDATVFLGLYTTHDIEVLLNHRGISLVIWGGADMQYKHLEKVKRLVLSGKCYTCAYPGEFSNILTSHKIPHKALYIGVKDYSNFVSKPLGDKIYAYKGILGNRSAYFNWNDTIVPLIDYFGESSIIYTDNSPFDELVNNYYTNSFIYVKPTAKGGCTAMFELGCMGRQTIGNGYPDLQNVIPYTDVSGIIKIIESESKYIGHTRDNISEYTKSLFNDDRWLEIDFWKK
jgi:hypothetical protein